jgi:hypothetical protein
MGKGESLFTVRLPFTFALFPFYPFTLLPSSPLPLFSFLFPLYPLLFASVTVSKLLFTLDSELTVKSTPDQCDGNATEVPATETFRRLSTTKTNFRL